QVLDLDERLRPGAVDDQDVDGAESELHLGDEGVDLGFVADVGLERLRLAAGVADLFDDALSLVRASEAVDSDAGAALAKRDRDGGAEATRCAGDERDFALQF